MSLLNIRLKTAYSKNHCSVIYLVTAKWNILSAYHCYNEPTNSAILTLKFALLIPVTFSNALK